MNSEDSLLNATVIRQISSFYDRKAGEVDSNCPISLDAARVNNVSVLSGCDGSRHRDLGTSGI